MTSRRDQPRVIPLITLLLLIYLIVVTFIYFVGADASRLEMKQELDAIINHYHIEVSR